MIAGGVGLREYNINQARTMVQDARIDDALRRAQGRPSFIPKEASLPSKYVTRANRTSMGDVVNIASEKVHNSQATQRLLDKIKAKKMGLGAEVTDVVRESPRPPRTAGALTRGARALPSGR
jgi:hypothetical protein